MVQNMSNAMKNTFFKVKKYCYSMKGRSYKMKILLVFSDNILYGGGELVNI